MKKFRHLMTTLGLMLALFVPFAAAQDECVDLYKKWYDAYGKKDHILGLSLAKELVAKCASDPKAQVPYLKDKYIPQARKNLFNQYHTEGKFNDLIAIGKEVLAENPPDDIDYLWTLVYDIRTKEISATPANFSHATDAMDFSQRAAKLIEGGKLPTNVPKEKANSLLAFLNQTMAVIEQNAKNYDKATEYYKKAISLDVNDNASNTYNYYQLGFMHQFKVDAASKKYEAFPEADKSADPLKPEVKSAFDDLKVQAQVLVDYWGHFLALNESNSYKTRADVEKTVLDWYKFLRDEKADGFQEHINGLKRGVPSTPPPSND
jgi:tetratricopeptide (TPR) repeat protein